MAVVVAATLYGAVSHGPGTHETASNLNGWGGEGSEWLNYSRLRECIVVSWIIPHSFYIDSPIVFHDSTSSWIPVV